MRPSTPGSAQGSPVLLLTPSHQIRTPVALTTLGDGPPSYATERSLQGTAVRLGMEVGAHAGTPSPVLPQGLTVRQHFISFGHLLEFLLGKLFIIWVLVWVPLQGLPPIAAGRGCRQFPPGT